MHEEDQANPPPPHPTQTTDRYNIPFFDRTIITIVTNSHESVNFWTNHLFRNRTHRLVGLGIEVELQAVATIHLCFDHYCLIYQAYGQTSFPLSLTQVLLNPDNTFVGFDLDHKLRILKRHAGFNRDVSYSDLRFLAAYNYSQAEVPDEADLSPLVTLVLRNIDLVRPQPDRRWYVRELSDQQVRYASIGAYVSLQMGRLLLTAARENPQRVIFRENRVEAVLEHVHEVHIFDRTIRTTVTKRLIPVENWIAENMNDGLLENRYVGFDVELFNVDNQPRIGTVQFCVGSHCLIIQFSQMNGRYLPNLEDFLLQDDNIFVGVDVRRKMRMLKDMLLFAHRGRLSVFDLGTFAAIFSRRLELNNAGLDALTELYIGVHVEIPHVGNDWGRPLLSHAQVECACIHAAASYEIVSRLRQPRDN